MMITGDGVESTLYVGASLKCRGVGGRFAEGPRLLDDDELAFERCEKMTIVEQSITQLNSINM